MVSFVVCLGLALLAPALASAQQEVSSGSDAEARGLFEAGRAAYTRGSYEAALDHFERAYELSGRPMMLFNIGQAADRARHDARAIEAFEAYLEQQPDAPNRAMVENRLEVIRSAAEDRNDTGAEGSESPSYIQSKLLSAFGETLPEDRFALGLSLGPGLMVQQSAVDEVAGVGVVGDASISFGWAILARLWLSVSLHGVRSPKIEYTNAGEDRGAAKVKLGGLELGADWYPKSNAGWHFAGGLGLYALDFEAVDGMGAFVIDESAKPIGIGLSLAAGYDWDLGAGWHVGALARLRLAPLVASGKLFATTTFSPQGCVGYRFH